MNLNTLRALLVITCLGASASADDSLIDWTTVIQPATSTTIVDMATDAAGNSFVVGTDSSLDVSLTRIDADGTFAWTRTYSGPGIQDQTEAVSLSWDETFVYVLARSSVPTGGSDYAILKCDAASGSLSWARLVDGGDSGIDSPSDIEATPDGGAVATGGFDTATEQRDFGTVRLDADGNVLWTRLYTGFGQFLFENDDAEFVAVNGAGDVAISGSAMSGSDSDIVTILYDGDTGATLWEATWPGVNNDVPGGLGFAPDGDVVMLGLDDLTSGRRWVLAKYALATGAERWSVLTNHGFDETARHLEIGPSGTVYATGSVDPDVLGNSNDNLVTMAVDGSTGTVLWITEFGGFGVGDGDFGSRLVDDGTGSVWIVGGTSSQQYVPDPLDTDGLLLELSAATGATRSITTLDTSTETEVRREALRHLGRDAQGRAYAVGEVTGASSSEVLAARFLLESSFGDLGAALAGTTGQPLLDGSGQVLAGETVTLSLTNALPLTSTGLVLGFQQLLAAFKGGTLVPSPDILWVGLPVDAAGSLLLELPWPTLPGGFEISAQHWIVDPGGPAGFSASNALSILQR